ncbi:hypothetical protein ACH4PR_55265, partial [Streptomyces mirabilis]
GPPRPEHRPDRGPTTPRRTIRQSRTQQRDNALFPHVESDEEPWPTLLWATGRGDLPGRDRLEKWRWYGEVREAE